MRFTKKMCLFLVGFISLTLGVSVPSASNASDCNPAPQASLVDCNFMDADLSNTDLTGANLTNANLTNANLTNANLTNANLTNANLTNAIVKNFDLRGAKLFGLIARGLRQAVIPGKLPEFWRFQGSYLIGPGVDLSGATPPSLTGMNLQGANLENANLSKQTLCGTNLTGSNLRGVNLTDTYLSSVPVGNCSSDPVLLGVKSGKVISTAKTKLPKNWKIYGGYLVGPGADLTGANLTGLNLSDAVLDGAVSSGIIGNPKLPNLWRLVRGVLVGPPTFLVRPSPTITGSLKVGSVLTANPGTWKPTPSKFLYQWFSSCPSDEGAMNLEGSSKTLKISVTPGCTLIVSVTATKTGYQSATSQSGRTSGISLGTFTSKQVPVIYGSPVAGQVLRVKCRSWSPVANLTFEWFANGVSIATGDTLLILPSEVGTRITAIVTAQASGYQSASAISKPTSIVKLR